MNRIPTIAATHLPTSESEITSFTKSFIQPPSYSAARSPSK
jgi:hypothetical protein